MVFHGHLIIIHLMMTIDGQKIEAAATKKALWEDPAMRWELSGWWGWLGNETWRIHGGGSNMETCGNSEIFILWTILDHFRPFWTILEKNPWRARNLEDLHQDVSEVSGGVDDCGRVLEDLQLLEGAVRIIGSTMWHQDAPYPHHIHSSQHPSNN